jgi:hypothetical protein
MGSRVAFSSQHLSIDEIVSHHQDVELSLTHYFSHVSHQYTIHFERYSKEKLRFRLSENDKSTIFTLLATVEAAFRIDYLQRSYQRKKDRLSKACRELHQQKGSHASLEEDILSAWKEHTSVPANLIGDLWSAFKYRHWLAHGRYWVPKLGQKYDYDSIYGLTEIVFKSFPFVSVR